MFKSAVTNFYPKMHLTWALLKNSSSLYTDEQLCIINIRVTGETKLSNNV